MNPFLAVVFFITGVVLVVVATGRLLEGFVGLARAAHLAPAERMHGDQAAEQAPVERHLELAARGLGEPPLGGP